MSSNTKKSFNKRAFVSVLSGFAFVLMAVTGLVLFFAPSCRIARDTDWRFLGQDKDQWVAVHIWLSIAFVVASAFHIYYNWRPLVNYFKNRLPPRFTFRAEWIVALILCAVVYGGSLWDVAPFSLLTDWKHNFHECGPGEGGQGRRWGQAGGQALEGQFTWDERDRSQADFNHQQQSGSSSGQLRDARGIEPTDSARASYGRKGAARDRNLHVGDDDRLYRNQEQRENIREGEDHVRQQQIGRGAGRGTGQKTLREFCDDEGIDLLWAVERLRRAGFTATGTMTMREIADEHAMHPRELRDILHDRQ